MRRIHFVLALLLALTMATAVAQDNKQKSDVKPSAPGGLKVTTTPATAHQDHKPASGSMTYPGAAELQKLKFMAGAWTTTEKFEPSEYAPKGGTGTGKAEIHAGPGRLSVLENYQSKNDMMGSFSGHAVMWYDAKEKAYKTLWCDSMSGCEASLGTGKWEGDKLVFSGQTEYQGKKIVMRDTFSDIKPDSFTMTEEISTDGGPMKTSMVIQYKKASSSAPAKPTGKE